MKRLKLAWYKWRLRRVVRQLHAIDDSYDCGLELIRFLNPRFSSLETKCNELYNKCLDLEFGEWLP